MVRESLFPTSSESLQFTCHPEGSEVTDPPLILSYGLMFRTLHSGQARLKGRPGSTAITWPNTRNDGRLIVLFHLFWDKINTIMKCSCEILLAFLSEAL